MKKSALIFLAILLCACLAAVTSGCKKDAANAESTFDSVSDTVGNDTVFSSSNSIVSSDLSVSSKPQSSSSQNNSSSQRPNTVTPSSGTSVSSVPERKPTSTDPDYYDTLRPWYNIGYSKQLRGAPIIYAIFIDDNDSSWDTASIEEFLSYELDPAVAYLEKEAEKWHVSLDLSVRAFGTAISNGYTFKYEGIVNRDLRSAPSTKDVLIKAAEDFGYSSEEELRQAVSSANGGREIIFLCILNSDGTSYTRNQASNGSTVLVEETVLFRRPLGYKQQSWLKRGQRASVVAHEMLHQFGAEDFYISAAREAIANQYYPDDIMLWQYSNIAENTLGDCVAYSVGWTDTVPEVCYNEQWWK